MPDQEQIERLTREVEQLKRQLGMTPEQPFPAPLYRTAADAGCPEPKPQRNVTLAIPRNPVDLTPATEEPEIKRTLARLENRCACVLKEAQDLNTRLEPVCAPPFVHETGDPKCKASTPLAAAIAANVASLDCAIQIIQDLKARLQI